jgi:hypothetical protein
MKLILRLLIFFSVVGLLIYYAGLKHSAPISAPVRPVAVERRPNLAAIFGNCNCQQWIDRFGTVSRSAFDATGHRIGTQVGHVGGPTGIVVEMTYLEPDAGHSLGQAFDFAGNPMPLHTGPETPDRNQEPFIS